VCDVRISSFIYVSLSFSQDKLEKDKGTLLAVNGTPPRRGIAIYSPIEGGFRGVCLSRFFFAFYPYLYFQERLKDFGDKIHLQKLDITREDIDGTFDLVLASEILYYLGGKNVLLPLEEKFYRHLRPGGYLLLCHFYPSGKIIHDIFRENNRFQEVSEKVTHHPHRDYIITLLKRQ
jgi:SAM-dependent methyltransferase